MECESRVSGLQGLPRLERMAPPARPLPLEALALIGQGAGAPVALPMPSASATPSAAASLPPLHSSASTPASGRGYVLPYPTGALESPGARSELAMDVPALQLPSRLASGSSPKLPTLARAPTEDLNEQRTAGLVSVPSIASTSSLGGADLRMILEPDAGPAGGLDSWSARLAVVGSNLAGESSSRYAMTPDIEAEDGTGSTLGTAATDPLGASSTVGVRIPEAPPIRSLQQQGSSSLGGSPTLPAPLGLFSGGPSLPDDVPALAYAQLAAEHSTAEGLPVRPSGDVDWDGVGNSRGPTEAVSVADMSSGSQLMREVSELAYVDRDPRNGSPMRRYRPTADAEIEPAALPAEPKGELDARSLDSLLTGPSQAGEGAQDFPAEDSAAENEAGFSKGALLRSEFQQADGMQVLGNAALVQDESAGGLLGAGDVLNVPEGVPE